ncbi:MAG: tRNA (adenosine(37)-N6)-threonylcarbamoyltransferase complex dimerization subunit type 1 TsaB [Mariprofundaceae bacterium]|nr:tRNA (adenosine(37)-N6)-threonylcarbamoyltransferase complex dimerization subunit type 1 TsaB [Mariprofundaceae bacterium]
MNFNNLLALDAASGALTACLQTASGVLHHAPTSTLPLSQSVLTCLTSLMQQAELDWDDLDALALGCGPGSFSGLRVSAATLAGLNSRLKLPILKLCSLHITYLQADTHDQAWVVEDARTQSVYVASFQHNLVLDTPKCLSLAQLSQLPSASYLAQQDPKKSLENWQEIPVVLRRSEALAKAVSLSAGKKDAQWMDYPELNYIQASQAERMMK